MSESAAEKSVSGIVSGSGKSNQPSRQSKLRFVKALDGRRQPVRGLWKRGDKYYARLSGRRADGTVNDQRVPLKARTTAEAKGELEGLRRKNRESGLAAPRKAPLLADYVPRYLEHAQLAKRPRTAALEAMHLRHWTRAVGNLRLDRICNRHVLDFRTRKLAGGWSKRSGNLSLVILRNLYRHAQAEGLVSGIPFDGIRSMKHVPKRRRLYSLEEIEAICQAGIRSTRYGQQLADYVRLMAFCGSRCEESLHLQWSDVDWEGRQLTIGSDGESKNHESRTVDFNPHLEAHLREMLLRRDAGSDWLFPSPRLKGERAKSFSEALKQAKAGVGDREFGYHHCRVFFCSRAIMSGIDAATVAAWCGHRDNGVLISRVYQRLNDEHKRRAAAKLEIG